MTKEELKLEALKLGLALTSPSSACRHEEVVKIGKLLYSEIIAVEQSAEDTQTPMPKRRGRPPLAG